MGHHSFFYITNEQINCRKKAPPLKKQTFSVCCISKRYTTLEWVNKLGPGEEFIQIALGKEIRNSLEWHLNEFRTTFKRLPNEFRTTLEYSKKRAWGLCYPASIVIFLHYVSSIKKKYLCSISIGCVEKSTLIFWMFWYTTPIFELLWVFKMK